MPEHGPAFYLGAEDDADEIHIRLAGIAEHYGVTFRELIAGGLNVLPLLGQDATLCAVGKSGKIEVTSLYRQLYEAAGDIKPKNIIDRYAVARLRRQRNRPRAGLRVRHAHAGAGQGGWRLGHGPEPSQPGRHRIRLGHIRLDRMARRLPVPAIPQGRQGQTAANSRTPICANSSLRRTSTAHSARASCCAISAACSYPKRVR